jgi:hypothetical protein
MWPVTFHERTPSIPPPLQAGAQLEDADPLKGCRIATRWPQASAAAPIRSATELPMHVPMSSLLQLSACKHCASCGHAPDTRAIKRAACGHLAAGRAPPHHSVGWLPCRWNFNFNFSFPFTLTGEVFRPIGRCHPELLHTGRRRGKPMHRGLAGCGGMRHQLQLKQLLLFNSTNAAKAQCCFILEA